MRLNEAEGGFLRMSELADKVSSSRSRLTHTIHPAWRSGASSSECAAPPTVAAVRPSQPPRARPSSSAAPTHVRSVRDLLLDVIGHDDLLEARSDPRQDHRGGRPDRRRMSGTSRGRPGSG